jgi:hypothetical protein
MKLENMEKAGLIIQEIQALETFKLELPDNAKEENNLFIADVELKVVWKGENIPRFIGELKYLVFQKVTSQIEELKEVLITL